MELDDLNFSVDSETREVKLLTTVDYYYDEKTLLQTTNIGLFGFGYPIKIGSNFTRFTPTNYNYMLDPYEIRFKHIDEVNGDVKNNAIDTYNFRYYFYSNYYTYTAG